MKTIVITGGSSGLGKAIAKNLAPENRVIILSPNEEELKFTADECRCDYRICDVTDPGAVDFVIGTILDSYETIDVLINNAGLHAASNVENIDIDEARRVYEVNVLGVMQMCKAVIPSMKEQENGLIINVNSTAGLEARAGKGVYDSSKWALRGFTDSLRAEVETSSIGVTEIYPGALEQGMVVDGEKAIREGLPYVDVVEVIRYVIERGPDTIVPKIEVRPRIK